MLFRSVLTLCKAACVRIGRSGPAPRRPQRFRPAVQALEDRLVPTRWLVTSSADPVHEVRGTLRYAVDHAHDGDVIDITPVSVEFHGRLVRQQRLIKLTQGELFLNHNVTIDGFSPSPTAAAGISGNFHSRVFEVAPGAVVDLMNLFIFNGNGAGRDDSGSGGAIDNRGTLTLSEGMVLRNTAALTGGAIANRGNLTIADSEVGGNSAAQGGGLYNDAPNGGANVFTTLFASDGPNVIDNSAGELILSSSSFTKVPGGGYVAGPFIDGGGNYFP